MMFLLAISFGNDCRHKHCGGTAVSMELESTTYFTASLLRQSCKSSSGKVKEMECINVLPFEV